jgi:hypothetical protein
MKCYEDLLATVPPLSEAALGAMHGQALREALSGLYREHLEIGLRALRLFGRKTGSIGQTTSPSLANVGVTVSGG